MKLGLEINCKQNVFQPDTFKKWIINTHHKHQVQRCPFKISLDGHETWRVQVVKCVGHESLLVCPSNIRTRRIQQYMICSFQF